MNLVKSLKKALPLDDKWKCIRIVLYAICLINLLLGCMTVALYRMGGDEAAVHILAKEMIETKSLFPSAWYSSTVTFFLSLEVPLAFFSLFIKDQMIVRSLALISSLCVAFAFFYLFSRKVLKNRSAILFCAVIFGEYSSMQSAMLMYQQAYLFPQYQMIFLVLCFIMYAMDENGELTILGNKAKWLAVFLLLAAALGSTNIIVYQNTLLPLLFAAVLYTVIKYKDKTLTDLFKNGVVKSTVMAVSPVIIAMIVGFVLKNAVVDPNVNVPVQQANRFNLCSREEIFTNFGWMIDSLFAFWGFNILGEQIPLLSLDGVTNILVVVFVIVFIFIIPVLAAKKYKEESHQVQFFMLFMAGHILEILIICIFCMNSIDINQQSKYIISASILLIFLDCHYLVKYVFSKINIVTSFLTLSLCAVLLPFNIGNFSVAVSALKGEIPPSFSMQIIEFLKSQDLKLGYCESFDMAKVIPVLSNFEVRMNLVGINDEGLYKDSYYLDTSRTYQPDYYTGNTFFLFDPNTIDTSCLLRYGEPIEKASVAGLELWIYDYNLCENNYAGKVNGYITTLYSTNAEENAFDGSIDLQPGDSMHGPYSDLAAGTYTVNITVDGLAEDEQLTMFVMYGEATEHICDQVIVNGENSFSFEIAGDVNLFQTYMNNSTSHNVRVTEIDVASPNG